MREFLAGIGAAFISIFGIGSGEPAQPVVYPTNQPAAAIVSQIAGTDSASATLVSTSTIVNQYITQPVIERAVLANDAITRTELDAAIAGLRADLLAAIQRSLPSVYTIGSLATVAPVSLNTFAHSQKIDKLANVTITNATLSGVAGLTDADIPDDITLNNYMPLSGGTVSGGLTVPYLLATSSTASSFASNVGIGSTTPFAKLSVTGNGTGTGVAFQVADSANSSKLTLFDNGSLAIGTSTYLSSLAPLLHIASDTTSGNQIVLDNSNSAGRNEILFTEAGATVGFVQWRGSANASSPSTMRLGSAVTGSSLALLSSNSARLTIDPSGRIGIGTTSPNSALEVSGSNAGTNLTTFTSAITSSITNRSTTNNSFAALAFRTQDLTNGAATSTAHISGVATSHTAGAISGELAFHTNANGLLSEKMRISSAGNVGIGTSSPGASLHIAANDSGDELVIGDDIWGLDDAANRLMIGNTDQSSFFRFGQSSSNFGILGWQYNATASNSYLSLMANGGSNPLVLQRDGGNVGIATTSPWRMLSVTGTVGFDGLTGSTGAGSLCLTASKEVVYNSGSDACLPSLRDTKHDISSLSLNGLQIIDQLDPVSFVYNEGDDRVRYGFIAEDTAAVDSHLVTYSASGTLSGIDDRSIISIVVKAIQEMRSKVDTLVATVAGFANRITTNELCVGSTCINEAQLATLLANAGSTGGPPATPSESEEATAIDTEPPVITITGNNPATLQVGDAYSDLGATVTDNVDLNLGYEIFVGSTPLDQAHINTSEPNEWHIHYVATDNAGNTATSTRTVIVESPSIVPAEEPEPTAS